MGSGKIKTLFIINPILEKKSGKSITPLISEHLDSERFEFKICYSEYPGHTCEIAQQNAGQYKLIVAGGGDGTINQAASSLVNSDTILGILPLGSGKGLARSLNIPLNIRKAIGTINRFVIARIDTGIVGKHRFVNIAGIGFSAEVANAYSGSKVRGFIPYAINTGRKLSGYSAVSASITVNQRTISGNYFDISIANSSQWGYGAHISPTSKPDDGMLEVCLLRKFPKILTPILLVRLFTKTIHRSRYMEVIPAKELTISGQDSFIGHIDGEPVEFESPLSITVDSLSLKVICAI